MSNNNKTNHKQNLRDENFNNNSISIKSGESSINIGNGNDIVNNVNIDNKKVFTSKKDEPIIYYHDEIFLKLPIRLNTLDYLKNISLILGILSSIITIGSFFLNINYLNYSFFMLPIMSFIIFFIYFGNMKTSLNTEGEMKLGNKGKKIIVEDNNLFITRKYGECLLCHSNVYLYYNKPSKNPIGKCSNYEGHIYSFDPTISQGVPFEIIEFNFK